MKKYVQLLTVLCMLLVGTQVSFAALMNWENGVHKDEVYDADAMLAIHSLAIANPLYTPVEEIEPQKDEMLDIIYKASEVDKKGYFTYMSYRDVCQKVKDSEKVDILRLERHKALAIFKPQIGKYVDAYVEVTVSNDTRLNIFYNVYNAKTNDVIYTYRKLAPKDSTRDALLYSELTKDFYRDFLDAIEKVRKDKEKEAKAIIKDDKVKVKDAEKTTD